LLRAFSEFGLYLAYQRSNSFLPQKFMSTPETSDSNETVNKELIVQNKMGIHARPAAMIVRIANTYGGEVWVEKDGEQVNGKSIMGLMMLAAGKGSKLVFRAEGSSEDGERMLDELSALFDRRFEEA
jgi:phosphocarrier protein